jgi:hypothetical protein
VKPAIVLSFLITASVAHAQPSTAPEPAPPTEPARPKQGVAVEVQIATGDSWTQNGMMAQQTRPGAFFGWRTKWVTVGLGMELDRAMQSQSFMGGGDTKTVITYWLASPGIRVVVASADDHRTELVGQLDFGIGQVITSFDVSQPNQKVDLYRFQIGPGLRHWLTRSFALGASAGLRYENASQDQSGSMSELSSTGFFSAVQVLGVF